MTQARLLEKLDAEVERWNRDNPIGTRVFFRPSKLLHMLYPNGTPLSYSPRVETVSPAFLHARVPHVCVSGLVGPHCRLLGFPAPLDEVHPC
jgi:hypothetical protein